MLKRGSCADVIEGLRKSYRVLASRVKQGSALRFLWLLRLDSFARPHVHQREGHCLDIDGMLTSLLCVGWQTQL